MKLLYVFDREQYAQGLTFHWSLGRLFLIEEELITLVLELPFKTTECLNAAFLYSKRGCIYIPYFLE